MQQFQIYYILIYIYIYYTLLYYVITNYNITLGMKGSIWKAGETSPMTDSKWHTEAMSGLCTHKCLRFLSNDLGPVCFKKQLNR